MWTVIWTTRAEKEMKKLDGSYKPVILKAIRRLKEDPYGPQTEKLKSFENLYSVRAGAHCRIIYEVRNGKLIVEIVRVGTHENIYRNLDRL